VAVVRVALPVAIDQLFDYWLPAGLEVRVGSLLRARLGRRRVLGVAVDLVRDSEVAPERLAPIDEVATDVPALPADLCTLARFVARYYQQPIGQCFAQMLPPVTAAQRRRGSHGQVPIEPARQDTHAGAGARELNADQRVALAGALPESTGFAPSLLEGVTGSGKTEVYFAAAARVIAAGGQALLLVPEINLTPQLQQRVATALPDARVAVLHSGLTPAERLRHWLAAARGEAHLVLGTRLAVFAPLPQLGLIVVDEEHDVSFKQQDGVRYHARDVAIYRARLRAVPIILGSATPALETYAAARRGRYRWLRLPHRASPQAAMPGVRLAPNRTPDSREGLGLALRVAIAERIQRGEQTLLFINRRGFAPSLLCSACGWKAQCPRCAARLVVHRDSAMLRCHHCGHGEPIATKCPDCGNQDLVPLGFGTQRLERALSELHPAARILRVDRDSTRRKGAFATMRTAIAAGEVDILVGTQMLAKGHDFPRLTLVGILGADNALYSADFRATERLFALLEQVAGRAGRGALPGEVLVQTDFPDHPLYAALVDHDYDRFAQTLLAERQALGLPPFAYLALLAAEAPSRGAVDAFLGHAVEQGRALVAAHALRCEVYPAVAAALARRAGLERGQVLVQSAQRSALHDFLPRWRAELERIGPRRVRWTLDVDPLGFA
jgi:primosomal protein N' (replication factor Y) (superfamily II helicase)